MTRYLVTGAGGMLGQDLLAALKGRDVIGASRAELDITDSAAVTSATSGVDVVINAAAFTNVDGAETDEALAHAINADGAANLARATGATGARLIQVSTDYVFDGVGTTPYLESAPIAPVSAYGRTKADGERLARELNPEGTFIVRTAWLYGEHGPNFASTMLRLASERETVDVVDDQVGQPTWTVDLAKQIVALIDSAAPAGNYHATNVGQTSWYGFARAIFAAAGHDPDRVKPTDSSRFVRPAPRPSYSVLGQDAWRHASLQPMREWSAALHAAFAGGALNVPEAAS